MGSVSDRWHVTEKATGRRVRSSRFGTGKRWQARYRDLAGESRNRSFERKVDAERFLVEISQQLLRGTYVDPRSGRMRFSDYAKDWQSRQVLAPTSRESVALRLRVHVLPVWGGVPLASIKPAAVQQWVKGLQERLAPGYVRQVVGTLSAVLGSAVDQGLLGSNPCASRLVRLPTMPARRVEPWPMDRVLEVMDAVPERYQALVGVAAGCGLRQGECFGLRVQDVDFLRGQLHVRQQIRIVGGRPSAALPKYGRTRTVPLPEAVATLLAAHLQAVEPLAGERVQGPGLGGLLFYSRERKPLNRNYFNGAVWAPALLAAGVPRGRENGMHALRHACASVWLERGVTIKAVSEYLGHADAGFTLRVYTHVMPNSGERARQAMDAAFGEGRRPAEPAATPGAQRGHKRARKVGMQ